MLIRTHNWSVVSAACAPTRISTAMQWTYCTQQERDLVVSSIYKVLSMNFTGSNNARTKNSFSHAEGSVDAIRIATYVQYVAKADRGSPAAAVVALQAYVHSV